MAGRIKIRAQKKGDVTEVKALMRHPMETGMRKDQAAMLFPHILLLRSLCSTAISRSCRAIGGRRYQPTRFSVCALRAANPATRCASPGSIIRVARVKGKPLFAED